MKGAGLQAAHVRGGGVERSAARASRCCAGTAGKADPVAFTPPRLSRFFPLHNFSMNNHTRAVNEWRLMQALMGTSGPPRLTNAVLSKDKTGACGSQPDGTDRVTGAAERAGRFAGCKPGSLARRGPSPSLGCHGTQDGSSCHFRSLPRSSISQKGLLNVDNADGHIKTPPLPESVPTEISHR